MRPLRRPVFLAGEGQSERGYGRWLSKLATQQGVPIAIRCEGLKGGDPLSLMEQFLDCLHRAESHRGRYRLRDLILDTDRRGADIERDEIALARARENGVRLIWQSPCHEGFLLRHFERLKNHNPPDLKAALRLLKTAWPSYTKGMDADTYGRTLSLSHLVTARSVQHELDQFLSDAGWGL